jgi:tetratricopeptide (TPR) repeat protein
MFQLRNLLQEIHRRSVWQVLGVYLAVSWVVIQVVETLTESAGLPDWVPPGALVLLLIGLPIVLATAFVQEGVGSGQGTADDSGSAGPAPTASVVATEAAGDPAAGIPASAHATSPGEESADRHVAQPDSAPNLAAGTGSLDRPSTRPSAAHRLFTWRNAIVGGVLAFAFLGVAVAGYWAMWATGIGPVGSLVAQGVLEERDPVILSDFQNLTQDAALGEVVTEALRVDLDRSEVLTLVSPAAVNRLLQRMGREDAEVLTAGLAREAALRGGIKAVIEGEVGAVGTGYVLTARLTDASGEVLASFRVTARDDNTVIDAIDDLSQDLRERSGESLRAIKSGEPLSAVTTASVEALRLYSRAIKLSTRGDRPGAVPLLEEAIILDPEFAMAYRKLGVELGNLNMDPDRALEALVRAYELRSRLTARERGLAEAYYFTEAEPDAARAIGAYEGVLADYPDEPTALNNLALLYSNQGRYDEGLVLLERAVEGPGATATSHNNLVSGLWSLRRDGEAERWMTASLERYPGSDAIAHLQTGFSLINRRWEEAHDLAERRAQRSGDRPSSHMQALHHMAAADAARGKLAEARSHAAELLRIARREDQATWVWDAAGHHAWFELLVARSPDRATALVDEALGTHPYEGGPFSSWELVNLASPWALAGEPQRAAGLVSRAEAAAEHDSDWDAAHLFYIWSNELATDDAEAAYAAIRRLMTVELQCGQVRRCWGHFESGMSLEALGRRDEAIEAYERHVRGIDLSEAYWDGVLLAASLEQLCHLSAEMGDGVRSEQHCGALLELWSEADEELQPRIRAAEERRVGALPADVGP